MSIIARSIFGLYSQSLRLLNLFKDEGDMKKRTDVYIPERFRLISNGNWELFGIYFRSSY
jgi:hypothetical protein